MTNMLKKGVFSVSPDVCSVLGCPIAFATNGYQKEPILQPMQEMTPTGPNFCDGQWRDF